MVVDDAIGADPVAIRIPESVDDMLTEIWINRVFAPKADDVALVPPAAAYETF